MFNSKNIKRIILLIITFCILLSVKSFAVVSQTKDFFVNDYAGVLTEETKNYIIQTNAELQQKTGAQIVVVTVKSLDGQSIEEYATELFRKFSIGDSQKNNGVLLLCSTGDRLFRIEVGYGLEGTLTDGKTGRIQDQYIIPYLKNNNYNDGIKNGFSAILGEVSNEYGITLNNVENPEKLNSDSQEEQTLVYVIIGTCLTASTINLVRERKNKIIFSVVYTGIYTLISFLTKNPMMIMGYMFFIVIFVIVILLDGNSKHKGNSGRGGHNNSYRPPYRRDTYRDFSGGGFSRGGLSGGVGSSG